MLGLLSVLVEQGLDMLVDLCQLLLISVYIATVEGFMNISDATITASSRMEDPRYGNISHLNDRALKTIFSTDCHAPIESRIVDWVKIKLKKVSSIGYVGLYPNRAYACGVRASNISILVKEGETWRKCANSGDMKGKFAKRLPCKARTQEIRLERKPVDTKIVPNGECLELDEVVIHRDPHGWTRWSRWWECSKSCVKRTRYCRNIRGFGTDPCGNTDNMESETKNCTCPTSTTSTSTTTTSSSTASEPIVITTVSNRPRSANYYLKKVAPYVGAFLGFLILVNIAAFILLYCVWKVNCSKIQEIPSLEPETSSLQSTPSSDLISLSSSVTNISSPVEAGFEIISS